MKPISSCEKEEKRERTPALVSMQELLTVMVTMNEEDGDGNGE